MPGEIRNKIYSHLFSRVTVSFKPVDNRTPLSEQSRAKDFLGCKRSKTSFPLKNIKTVTGRATVLRRPHVLGRNAYNRGPAIWKNSISGILLTCHKIHDEAVTIMYDQCTFVFADPKHIRAFIKTTPSRHLEYVTHLDLFVKAYGRSIPAVHNQLESKHIQGWEKTFDAVVKGMPNLVNINLSFQLTSLALALDPLQVGSGNAQSPVIPMVVAPLHRLKKLKELSVHIDTRERRIAKDKVKGRDMFSPLFINAGNNQPCRNKMNKVIMRNKELVMVIHTALENAIEGMIHGKTKTEAFVEVNAATLEHITWWDVPIGKTFSNSNALT